jgi:hypothetical protein
MVEVVNVVLGVGESLADVEEATVFVEVDVGKRQKL